MVFLQALHTIQMENIQPLMVLSLHLELGVSIACKLLHRTHTQMLEE